MKIENVSKLRIVSYPDPVLRRKCKPVTEWGGDLDALVGRMLMLMRENKGVGLAAPQVGVPIRLFVCNPSGDEGRDQVLVNPRIVESNGPVDSEEGCLSIPGVTVTMRRARHAVVEASDTAGKPIRAEASELHARVWQHEIDHLDGKLIIDRMSEADAIANKKAIRQLEEDAKRKR